MRARRPYCLMKFNHWEADVMAVDEGLRRSLNIPHVAFWTTWRQLCAWADNVATPEWLLSPAAAWQECRIHCPGMGVGNVTFHPPRPDTLAASRSAVRDPASPFEFAWGTGHLPGKHGGGSRSTEPGWVPPSLRRPVVHQMPRCRCKYQ